MGLSINPYSCSRCSRVHGLPMQEGGCSHSNLGNATSRTLLCGVRSIANAGIEVRIQMHAPQQCNGCNCIYPLDLLASCLLAISRCTRTLCSLTQSVILDYLASKRIQTGDLVVVSPDVGGVAR